MNILILSQYNSFLLRKIEAIFLEENVKTEMFDTTTEIVNFLKEEKEEDKEITSIVIVDCDILKDLQEVITIIGAARSKNIPLIATSYNSKIRNSLMQFGATFFIEKPLLAEELLFVSKNLVSISNRYLPFKDANPIILAFLRAIESRDKYTENHSLRVSEYSLMLYDYIEFTDKNLREIMRVGCLLHDIGKIGIPDSILNSTGKLSDDERKKIEKHPLTGINICKGIKGLSQYNSIIRSHHEKLDGSGYPDGLKGSEIPYYIRIIVIADIFDALTSDRTYRKGNDIKTAIRIMQEQEADKGKIDKLFFDEFKNLIKQRLNIII